MNKIVFYLMNEKGLFVLKNFLTDFTVDNIAFIVISEDKAIEKDYYNNIVMHCEKNFIKWYNKNDNIPEFNGYKFAIGWRWLISDTKKLIVMHDSILPKYRGFAPLVSMLTNGEDELGVTALFASEDYDKGNIIAQEKTHIIYPIRIQDAIDIVSPLYYKLIKKIFNWILSEEKILGTVQEERLATYSLWRDEKDYFIDWNNNSQYIRRKVDAVSSPYLGARTYLDNNIVIIDEVIECQDLVIENRDVGKIIFYDHGYPVVVCGEGLIKIIKARYLSGKSMLPLNKFRIRFGDKHDII